MNRHYHPLIKELLDGERSLADLPPALRAEGEAALRWLAAVDRGSVTLSERVDERVMARVRRHARSPGRRAWQWLVGARDVDIRLRIRPWALAAACTAAVLMLVVWPSRKPATGPDATQTRAPVYVRFFLYAPEASRVAVAGSFNHWDASAAPLEPTRTHGLWTGLIALPPGQHQYVFVVDGVRWVTDPSAPMVDDGFGRQNSVVAVTREDGGGRTL